MPHRLVALIAAAAALVATSGRAGGAGPAPPQLAFVLAASPSPRAGAIALAADGVAAERVLIRGGRFAVPRWAPDGRRIAFESRSAAGSSVFVLDLGTRRLLPVARQGAGPAWSPDGKRIAYAGAAGVLAADSRGLRKPRRVVRASRASHVAWSPDGRTLAYDNQLADGSTEIRSVGADGSRSRRLAGGPADDSGSPVWSPDGKRIAFLRLLPARADGAATPKLYVMNADGTGRRAVTGDAEPGVDEVEPSWSPDGSRLAFVRGTDLVVVDADGRAEQVIAGNAIADPVWSPDGRRVAFAGLGVDRPKIFVVGSDGSDLHSVTRGSSFDYEPQWRPGS